MFGPEEGPHLLVFFAAVDQSAMIRALELSPAENENQADHNPNGHEPDQLVVNVTYYLEHGEGQQSNADEAGAGSELP